MQPSPKPSLVILDQEISPSKKTQSFKNNGQAAEMQETLKLIQQVTSSILDNKNMSSFKLRSNNVKAHVTRINNIPPSIPPTSNLNGSAQKKKQTLVIPRSAIQIANKP